MIFFLVRVVMPRLLNRDHSSQNRRNTRVRVMSTDPGLIFWLKTLENYQKQRVNTGRNLPNINKRHEKFSEKVLRNHFRRAGASSVLPSGRVKMISKLRNVAAIINARRRALANKKYPRRANVPSLNVQYGKRLNGRGPNVLVSHFFNNV